MSTTPELRFTREQRERARREGKPLVKLVVDSRHIDGNSVVESACVSMPAATVLQSTWRRLLDGEATRNATKDES